MPNGIFEIIYTKESRNPVCANDQTESSGVNIEDRHNL